MRLRRFVRWMTRGSTTPSLFASEDGTEWVVKASGHTFRDGLVEILASRLASALGVITPDAALVEFDSRLLAAMHRADPALRALAETVRRGGGLAFGSRLCLGSDWVVPTHSAAVERGTIGHLAVFDRWIANADRRPDNTNLLLAETDLIAIDHAQSLPWLYGQTPTPAPHVRDAFGTDAAVSAGERAALGVLAAFTRTSTVRAALGHVPGAWAAPDELEILADILAERARTMGGNGS